MLFITKSHEILRLVVCTLSGNLTLTAYEEDCEFADPAGSFKGLRRFKRNCTNFGSLLEKSNMKLMRWEDSEVRSTAHSSLYLQTVNITSWCNLLMA